jgi:hypothetical protein
VHPRRVILAYELSFRNCTPSMLDFFTVPSRVSTTEISPVEPMA